MKSDKNIVSAVVALQIKSETDNGFLRFSPKCQTTELLKLFGDTKAKQAGQGTRHISQNRIFEKFVRQLKSVGLKVSVSRTETQHNTAKLSSWQTTSANPKWFTDTQLQVDRNICLNDSEICLRCTDGEVHFSLAVVS